MAVILASMPGSWEWIACQRHRLAIAGTAIFALAMFLFSRGALRSDTPADAGIATLFTWVWVLAFLGYGYRHLSFSNPLLRWARDASYPVSSCVGSARPGWSSA